MVPNWKAALFPVVLTVLLASGSVGAEDGQARMTREATEVFRTVLAETAPPTCGLDTRWATESVPESTARTFFSLSVHAGLAPPDQSSEVRDVLDPGKQFSSAFCDDQELSKKRDELLSNFQQDRSEHLAIASTGYTFPVFDDRFQKAILVRVNSIDNWKKTPDGVRPTFAGLYVEALMLKKVNGAWKQVAKERLGETL